MPDLEPITRLEEYLSKLAGSDVPVPAPITRVEKFLAYIAGEADSKPTPITRVEKFLDAIGQGGGGGGGETVIVPEQSVTTEVGVPLNEFLAHPEELNVGDTVTVNFDGTDYELTANGDASTILIGEADGETPDFTNYPFLFVDIVGYNFLLFTETSGTHTIKVTKQGGSAPVLVDKTITSNGTYFADDDGADGYDEVTVSVPNTYMAGDEGKVVSNGALVSQTAATYTANSVYDTTLIDTVTVNVSGGGGGSSYTLLASQDFEVNTTSTTDVDVGTMNLGSSAFTSDKILYVKIRDKAGKRASHVLGGDTYYFNFNAANGSTSTFQNYATLIQYANSSNIFGAAANPSYGVKAVSIASDGTLTIKARYTSSFGAIDGTFNVSVYLLDYAPNQGNPFNYSY